MSDRQAHWNDVYASRDEEDLTWFEKTPEQSLALIGRFAETGDPIIDIGGGASRLVDGLLAAGHAALTVLDLSDEALRTTARRLGGRGGDVLFIAADITQWQPAKRYAVWHDRAVFHFLTGRNDRAAYVQAMHAALDPDGIAIIATFAEDGPETCSGLLVRRYSPAALAAEIETQLPGAFEQVESQRHIHVTPKGNRQAFQISVFRRCAD